jgi:hypothetical protein
MECESISCKTLAQYAEDPLGIEELLEHHHSAHDGSDRDRHRRSCDPKPLIGPALVQDRSFQAGARSTPAGNPWLGRRREGDRSRRLPSCRGHRKASSRDRRPWRPPLPFSSSLDCRWRVVDSTELGMSVSLPISIQSAEIQPTSQNFAFVPRPDFKVHAGPMRQLHKRAFRPKLVCRR